MKDKKNTSFLVQASLIAAIYALSTWLCSVFGIAYGPVQFRLSEALTVISAFTPASIPGLTIGCFISNLGSPMGVWDMVFGSAATFFAAVTAYALRNIKIKKIPIPSIIMPVLFNGLIIGAEISVLTPTIAGRLTTFLVSMAEVAISELVVCILGGIPLYYGLERSKIFKRK